MLDMFSMRWGLVGWVRKYTGASPPRYCSIFQMRWKLFSISWGGSPRR